MTRRKGYNIKEMSDPILVEDEVVTEWQKIRKSPKPTNLTPQQERFREYGNEVRKECSGLKGDPESVRRCHKRVRERVFGKK